LRDFGPREFSLVLLRRMEDFEPLLVEDAATFLGADRTEMRAVHRWWQAAIRSRTLPSGTRRAGLVLGRPEHDERMPYGDLTVVVRQWALPLWSDLRWQIVAAPTGTVLQETLVRAPGVPRPDVTDVAALPPWSCTVDDIAAGHPDATHHDDGVQSRWTVIVRAADGHDRRLTFAWGLLQRVSIPDD
jgi:hypothetical protein